MIWKACASSGLLLLLTACPDGVVGGLGTADARDEDGSPGPDASLSPDDGGQGPKADASTPWDANGVRPDAGQDGGPADGGPAGPDASVSPSDGGQGPLADASSPWDANGILPDAGCIGSCAGRQCGDDGCGGSCGVCGNNLSCNGLGACVESAPRFAYVANSGSDDVSVYAISAATGDLTQVICGTATGAPCGSLIASNFAAGSSPNSVAVDPSGKYAFVAGSGGVSAFTINASTGALAVVAGSPFKGYGPPTSVVVSPTGKLAFASDNPIGGVTVFTIDTSTGALASVLGSSSNPGEATGNNPYPVAVDPTGKFAYVGNQVSNDVSAFTINPTGALKPIVCGTAVGSPCSSYWPANFAAAVHPYSITVGPSGKFAYLANSGTVEGISVYAIDVGTGALTAVTSSPIAAGSSPFCVTVDPSGRFVYVANHNSNNVSAYTLNAGTGALTPVAGSPFLAGSNPSSVVVDPSGKFAYVANSAPEALRGSLAGSVTAYAINGSTGALTPIGTAAGVAAGTNPVSVTIAGSAP